MFCKRCHKKIIIVVKDLYEAKNKCICNYIYNANGFISVTTEKTELTGVRNGSRSERK